MPSCPSPRVAKLVRPQMPECTSVRAPLSPAPTTDLPRTVSINRSRRTQSSCFFFFNDTATTEIYTLSLHDALPISEVWQPGDDDGPRPASPGRLTGDRQGRRRGEVFWIGHQRPHRRFRGQRRTKKLRSEEHTSELQSHLNLVCRLLLEKKKTIYLSH